MKIHLIFLIIFFFISTNCIKISKKDDIKISPLFNDNIPRIMDGSNSMLTPGIIRDNPNNYKNPAIAEEKIKLNIESDHPVTASIPRIYGYKKGIVEAPFYDTNEGKLVNKKVITDIPIVHTDKDIMNMHRKDTIYLKKDGTEINSDQKLEYHGI